jgi:predicted metal-binding membrane protein
MLLAAAPGLMDRLPLISGLLVILAGLYQFTRLKTRCLDQCQQPALSFGAQQREGEASGIAYGIRHGVTCIGCCSGYMVALVALGAMDLRWMVGAAVLIGIEKLGPRTHLVPLLLGIGLVVVGALVALAIIPVGGGMTGTAM